MFSRMPKRLVSLWTFLLVCSLGAGGCATRSAPPAVDKQQPEILLPTVLAGIEDHHAAFRQLFCAINEPRDEARSGFVQDLLFSQGLVKAGYVLGAKSATVEQPAKKLTDDPYFSDGLRAVMLLDRSPQSIRELQFFSWDRLSPHHRSRQLDLDK